MSPIGDGRMAQHQLDELAGGLDVRVRLTDNQAQLYRDGTRLGAHQGSIYCINVELRNTSSTRLPETGWWLHVPNIQRLLVLEGADLQVRHVTGDSHIVTPQPNFTGLEPGDLLSFTLIGETYVLAQSEFLPRWYLAATNKEPRVIASTDTDDYPPFLEPFGPDVFYAKDEDNTVRVTPQIRFARNELAFHAHDQPTRVIPKPLETKQTSGGLISVATGFSLVQVSSRIPAAMTKWWEQRATVLGTRVTKDDGLPLAIAIDPDQLPPTVQHPEGYSLSVSADGVAIVAFDVAAANHAMMTLFGLLPRPGADLQIPAVEISDAPRYRFRSAMIDIARNMRSLDFLHRFVDQMSAYKLNFLHLHLSDDEGWRLEIPGLPELTSVGARRGHTIDERDRLLSQLGSGPDSNNSGSGFLTRSEYIDLVRYAHSRGVSVLPEVNMPGHARAAVMAMESRYENLLAQGRTDEANEFRLVDGQDVSNILTVQHYGMHGTMNPAAAGSANFVRHVVNEIVQMHDEAGFPLHEWHFGGDEVRNILLGAGYCDYRSIRPESGIIDQLKQDPPWSRSPEARRVVTQYRYRDIHELPVHFAKQRSKDLAARGLSSMHVWHDLLDFAGDSNFALPVIAEVWTPLSVGGTETLTRLQGAGFETVGCAPDFTYFDGPYEADPAEPGTTWATRWLDEWITFSYPPDNPPQAAATSVTRFGHRYYVESKGSLKPMYGIALQHFSEASRTDEQAEFLIFPRLLAFAERAWHRGDWELDYREGVSFGADDDGNVGNGNANLDTNALRDDYLGFAGVVGCRELAKLDAAGIRYRVPVPGAKRQPTGEWSVNSGFPGLQVQVSTDGSTWTDIERNFALDIESGLFLRALSADGARASRVITVE